MKKIILSSVVVAGLIAGNYGAAGCGVGSAIFGASHNTLAQLLAMSTNQTFGQSSSILSGTSNCDAKLFGSAQEYFKFMKNNTDEVALDISKGGGEYVDTIAAFYSLDKALVAKKLQANFARIYISSDIQVGDIMLNIDAVLKS